ncbi:MAG: GtrA family protein [Tannerella sp.]|jgi:putative flippase GtrA|nr:GtrA family protein [Tannerella sp.]
MRTVIRQAIKYGIVGVGNTLLTLVIILIMTKGMGCAEAFSNFTGYIAGLISSYILNRQWTFHSGADWRKSLVRFFGVFAACYVLQLLLLLVLNGFCPENPPLYGFFRPVLQPMHVDPLFYIQMLAMAFYTVLNFTVNKFYTFKT